MNVFSGPQKCTHFCWFDQNNIRALRPIAIENDPSFVVMGATRMFPQMLRRLELRGLSAAHALPPLKWRDICAEGIFAISLIFWIVLLRRKLFNLAPFLLQKVYK